MFNWEDGFDDTCEKIRKENKDYLELFQVSMEVAGLSKKTVKKHLSNVEAYLNSYLLSFEALRMEDGIVQVNSFFDYELPRKWIGYNPSDMAASLRKFYKLMHEHGFIDDTDYEIFREDMRRIA